MRNRFAIAVAATIGLLACSAPAANAEHGDPLGAHFGLTGSAGLPVYSGAHAFWGGMCDIRDGIPDKGGVGTPLTERVHCIDHGGAYNPEGSNPSPPRETAWLPGFEPAWRLDPVLQAGARSDAGLSFWMRRYPDVIHLSSELPMKLTTDGDVRDIFIELPPGIGGNPNAVAKCPSEALITQPITCPPESQIGIMTLTLAQGIAEGEGAKGIEQATLPWYNVEPRDGHTAELLFSPGLENRSVTNIPVDIKVRTDGDFGITGGVIQIPAGRALLGQTSTFWGVPWSATHDKFRPTAGYKSGGLGIPEAGLDPGDQARYDPSWGPIRSFASAPTECADTLLSTRWIGDSWQFPATSSYPEHFDDPNWRESEIAYDGPITGCEKVPFDPDFSLQPTTKAAETPTGLEVELTVPQNNDAPFPPPAEGSSQEEVDAYVKSATEHWKSDAGLATSHMKDTVATLPLGMTVNPASAQGQQACTEEQIGLKGTDLPMPTPIRFDNGPVECPDASKIGTVATETSLLDEEDWPKGSVYLAEQDDNPFGSQVAIYLAVESPRRGLLVKAAGEVKLDPRTGQVTTVFANNPQLAIDELELHFKGGALAPLVTPSLCGSPASHTEIAPWARPEQPVAIEDPISIASGPNGSACPNGLAGRHFDLDFEAGTADPIAGAHSPFHLRIARPDGAQEIDRLELKTPRGFTASLKGVPYCSEAQIAVAAQRDGRAEQASPSCPAASRIGSVLSGAGAGPSPLYVPGDLYLAGPYKGAPLSMAAVIPAVAGPFDLGTVVVRTALRVNPATAQITAFTDPLPQILEGIPLRIRDIRVNIDRPGFALNPTSCAEQLVSATVYGSHGAMVDLSNRFQVGGCENLGFKPKLAFRLRGGTRRGDLPSLRATLKARPGDANIGAVSVAIPRSLFLEQENLDNICTRVQFAAHACPKGSIYGYAKAWSPLLDQPLEGAVHLRSSDNKLPDMVADLRGQIDVEVAGRIDSKNGQIRNTFDVVPDAAVSKFVLTLKGGKDKGILVNSRNLCAKPSRATVRMSAHNGRRHNFRPLVVNPKCKKSGVRKKRPRR